MTPHPPELLPSLEDLTPVWGVILALVAYAWRRLNATVEKLWSIHDEHAKRDDEIHTELFTRLRQDEEKLNMLIGEHKKNHDKG